MLDVSIDAKLSNWDVLLGLDFLSLATTRHRLESNEIAEPQLAWLFGVPMRKAFLALFALCGSFWIPAVAQTPGSHPAKTAEIITVSQIHAGMRGVAYTVFEGIKPEPMDVEVLGVL